MNNAVIVAQLCQKFKKNTPSAPPRLVDRIMPYLGKQCKQKRKETERHIIGGDVRYLPHHRLQIQEPFGSVKMGAVIGSLFL